MRADGRFETWCPNVVVLDDRMISRRAITARRAQNSAQDPDAVEFGYTIYPGGAATATRRRRP